MNNNKSSVVYSYLSTGKKVYSNHVKCYLKEIYKDAFKRSGRNIDKFTFHEITNFPMIIAEKIFFNINISHNNQLSLGEFTNGLYDLLFSKIEKLIDILFHIFDFDNDRVIHIEDVKLIFSFFHMINLTTSTEYIIMNIINKFFENNFIMDFAEFSSVIINNRNFDLLFLFRIFLKKFSFFSINQIDYISSHCEDTTQGEQIINDLITNFDYISMNCIDYAAMIIDSTASPPIQTNDEDLNELNELDDFENDLGNAMMNYHDEESGLGSYTIDNENLSTKLTNFFQMKKTKQKVRVGTNVGSPYRFGNITNNSSPQNLFAHTSKPQTYGLSESKNVKNYKMLFESQTIDLFPLNTVTEFKLNTLKKSFKISQCKIVVVDNALFYFTMHPQNNYLFLKRVLILSGVFPKIENQIVIDKKVYTPILLVSTLHNYKITKTFLSSHENEIKALYDLICNNANIRKVDDYYKFGPEIGKGKFGKVNFGKAIGSEEKVAIKIVPKYNATTSTSEEDYRIMRWEMDIFKYLKNAHHQNIIACFNIFETSSYIYYIYEYMNNGTLKDYLKTATIETKVTVEIVLQLLKGLSFLHTHGIIHRDIKHTNVMVSVNKNEMPTVKIIDFGLSRVLGQFEECRDPYGSLSFQAPEMLIGQPYNFKVDVWSLGVTVYYLLYKSLPFDDKTGEKVKESILCDDFSLTPLNNMNKNELGFSFIFSLICDCLTKSSSQRPDIFQIIKSYFKTNSSSIHNSNSIITTNTSNVNSSIKIK